MFCLSRIIQAFGINNYVYELSDYDNNIRLFATKDKETLNLVEVDSDFKIIKPLSIKLNEVIGVVTNNGKVVHTIIVSKTDWFYISLIDSVETIYTYNKIQTIDSSINKVIDGLGIILTRRAFASKRYINIGFLLKQNFNYNVLASKEIYFRGVAVGEYIKITLIDDWQLLYTKLKTMGKLTEDE